MTIVQFQHQSPVAAVGESLCGRMIGILTDLQFKIRANCASELRECITAALRRDGWSDPVQIDKRQRITITAMLGTIGLCLQTGNMARFYADLLKLQALYLDAVISGAFYLLPTLACAHQMGSNIANYERLTTELSQVFSKVITVPTLVVGFEN